MWILWFFSGKKSPILKENAPKIPIFSEFLFLTRFLTILIFLGNWWRNVYSSQWSCCGRRRQHYRCGLAQWPRPSLHLFRCLYHQIRVEGHESRWIWSTQWNLHLSWRSHYCCGFWKQPSANILRILWYWIGAIFKKTRLIWKEKGYLNIGVKIWRQVLLSKPEKINYQKKSLIFWKKKFENIL